MLKLAQELKKAKVKFRWIIFTDLELYGQRPFDLEEIVYMKPSLDFWDYITEADYGVQLSDTEGYSYFINECLQYGTPVICTDFPSVYESVEEGKNGYILDMELKNLDIDKIVNNIPQNFEYKEKCSENDWINFLNKKVEKKTNKMYKIIAKQNYKDTRAELIEKYINKEIKYNELGDAIIEGGDMYVISSPERAKQIEKSGLAVVIELKEKSEKEKTKELKKESKEKDCKQTKKTTSRTAKRSTNKKEE